MKTRSVLPMRIAKYGYIVISTLFCLAGLAMVLMPAASAAVIGRGIGISMILFGGVKLVGFFSKDLFRLAFQYDLEFGIMLMVLGVISLCRPDNVVVFLCVALGVCFIAESLFKFRIALDAKNFGIRNWWLTAVASVIAAIAGILLAFHPSEAAGTLIVMMGCALIAEGIQNLSAAISMVKIVKHQIPDVIDTKYYEIR